MLGNKSISDVILIPRSLSPPYEYIEDGDFRDTLKSRVYCLRISRIISNQLQQDVPACLLVFQLHPRLFAQYGLVG